jgi:TRAP-type C4-dicarboxylate transport system permease small subunit
VQVILLPDRVFSGILAVLFVVVVATVVGYFMARVLINDHYEFNSELMAILIVGPATIGGPGRSRWWRSHCTLPFS